MLQSSLNNFGEERKKRKKERINITITIGFCKILQKPNNKIKLEPGNLVLAVFAYAKTCTSHTKHPS
jgi:hypothetical protein